MHKAELEHYLTNLKGAEASYPFGPEALVYKVMGKMFALVSQLDAEPSVTLKVLPVNGEVLVDQFSAIIPGYHMNKRHWITVTLDRDVPSAMLQDLADQSYALVVSKLTKKQQLELQQLAHVEE